MEAPKFKVGDLVSVNGSAPKKIKKIETHGAGFCECCDSNLPYYCVSFGGSLFVNENQLKEVISE